MNISEMIDAVRLRGEPIGTGFECYTAVSCDQSIPQCPGSAAYSVYYFGRDIPTAEGMPLTCKIFGLSNIRLELTAIISCVAHLPAGSRAVVYSGSQPCVRLCQDADKGKRKDSVHFDLLLRLSSFEQRLNKVTYVWKKPDLCMRIGECRKAARAAYFELCNDKGIMPNYMVMNGFKNKQL